MNINQFNKPTEHPYGMLSGYQNASEKEALLAFILAKCIDAGDFIPVKIKYNHNTMVEDGLLAEDSDGYRLTKLSIGLLYSVYGV